MSHSRRFLPLIIFGVIGCAVILVAGHQVNGAKTLEESCNTRNNCAQAHADYANDILVGMFGTALIMVGGFVSVLVGQRDGRPRAGATLPQHSAPSPPYGPPPGPRS